MFSKKSIRTSFIIQLVSASATLIVVFSAVLYGYIKISILKNLNESLINEALGIIQKDDFVISENALIFRSKEGREAWVEIVTKQGGKKGVAFEQFERGERDFLSVYYPYEEEPYTFLKLTYDITDTNALLSDILFDILAAMSVAVFLVIWYAFFLSRMLLVPVKTLNSKLASMNENFLKIINTSSLPDEFNPLGQSINRLVDRIHTFVKYQKELFIGAAHELKTPLAVMKTKNEVTLLKKRENEKYIEALCSNNTAIDEMNKMISSILEIGRQEGAHFEEPQNIDLIKFLRSKIDGFSITIPRESNKHIKAELKPKSYEIITQPTLLTHIVQNFVQNAVKFTKEESTVTIHAFEKKDGFCVEVLDEGNGIDESKDLFAPFKRFGDKAGVGLGLFLAKGAADALGANITLKNRTDGKSGTIATLFIPKAQKK